MFRIARENGKSVSIGKFKSASRLSSYSALIVLLLSVNAYAITGVGEYRFGPDTTENLACEIAEDRAKENALIKFNGQFIEAAIEENCQSEDCKFNRQTFTKVEGYLKNVLDTKKSIRVEQGYRSCVVVVTANVEKLKNNIELMIDGSFEYKDGQQISFRGLSNSQGNLFMFNFYNDKYVKVITQKVMAQNKEFVLPSESYRMKAQLPNGEVQSKELLLFLFVNNDVSMKDSYTELEMKSAINQIPASNRRVITRYINILRR